jgi:hypothetical protein
MAVGPEYSRSAARAFAVGWLAPWLTGCRSGEPLDSRKAAAISFDTDMGTDVRDAGALAVLHILADRGEARILATMSANRNRWCATVLEDVLLTPPSRPPGSDAGI